MQIRRIIGALATEKLQPQAISRQVEMTETAIR